MRAVVAVTNTGVASKTPARTTFTSVPVVSWASIKTCLALHVIIFYGCGNISRLFFSMKLFPRRTFNASLSTMQSVSFVVKLSICTYKSTFPITSIESLEEKQKCTCHAAWQWIIRCSVKKYFAIKYSWNPKSSKKKIWYYVRLCIPTDLNTIQANLPIISNILFYFLDSWSLWFFYFSYLSL